MPTVKPSQQYFCTAALETLLVSAFYGITIYENLESDHKVYVLGAVGIVQAVFTCWFAYSCLTSKSMYGYFASMFTHLVIVVQSVYRLQALKKMRQVDKIAAYVTCGAQLFYLIEARFVAHELSWASLMEMGSSIVQHKLFKHKNLFLTMSALDLQATIILSILGFYYLSNMFALIMVVAILTAVLHITQRLILGRGIKYSSLFYMWILLMLVQPAFCMYALYRVNGGHQKQYEHEVNAQLALAAFFAIFMRMLNLSSFAICYRDRKLHVVAKNNQVLLNPSVYNKLGQALLDSDEHTPAVVFAVPITSEANGAPLRTAFNSRSSPQVKTQQISLSPTESLPQIESFKLNSTLQHGDDEFDLVDPQSFSNPDSLI